MTVQEAKKRLLSRKFGVFTHFLGGADWNERCNMYDTERVAHDLHKMGAGYYFLTIMQGGKLMCSPNAAYDRIAGTKPGEACCTRDLIGDLIKSLAKYDIDLCLYYTGDGPYSDPVIGPRFGFGLERGIVSPSFVENWASVLEEYAVRYGEGIKGWWIDGCYDYFGYNNELLAYYHRAVKKGNPAALVAMNNGVKDRLFRWYENEEITAGEFNDFICIPHASDIDGAMPHILAPLGISPDGSEWGSWLQRGCKRDTAYMENYIKAVNRAGGVVTVDIYIGYDSSFDPEQVKCLADMRL